MNTDETPSPDRRRFREFAGMRLLMALAMLVSKVGCSRESPPRALLNRLTITVDTPEGQKVGSSVARLWVGFGDGPLGGMGVPNFFNVKGAATVVDLGPRGYLLCLLWRDERRRGSPDQEGLLVQFMGTDNRAAAPSVTMPRTFV